ncbi:Nucleolar pre-ribosomal-associated protein 2 [Wickerhamomyces ciferrii]|uniref:Nucleolar pre-ribosomal-associated protein 2 n=1 Tax=Wickerhamomyces ciferrii (strain ATCC 14091 / BCRC 22168 / CBS 111 / JCM 3599 / NBRC 0793 / NRRL Y-1031 F-60-10) TaxID=1206466 RepID=K0KKT9_WICCF|nr:Nucleolar pre-ribosomal-associated protein 2 [Wickerhamomyces ciferrii]CCH43626.1 Nucleolar pre-ribosomal-associated protein 2 [Wickerhamomyces ciferrii]
MNQIRSAEGITRFLRSKDTSIDEVVQVGYELLQGQLNVYLPNKKSFVFELLCDRLSDVKTKKFRTQSSIWSLLYYTWCELDDEPKLRNRIFQNLKFGEALVDGLSHVDNDISFINALSDIMNATRLASLIGSNTLEYSIDILSKYLEIIQNIKENLSDAELGNHIHTITSFYQTIISAENLNKKYILKFASIALPIILQLSASIHNTENNKQHTELLSIIKKVLLNKEQKENLIPNLEALLKSKPTNESLVLYYDILLDTISKDDIKTAEKLFTLITNKTPGITSLLLKSLSNLKRTLSQSFLDDIIIKEFDNKTQDWNLILSVIQLDIEIGIKHAEQIFISLDSQKNENWLKLGEQLLNCFIRAREFLNFFKLLRKILIETEYSSYWSSIEFSDLISQNVYVLSITEMNKLTESIFQGEQTPNKADYILLNSIVQGLFNTQDITLVEQSKNLLKPIWEINDDDEELWRLKYQILCLYEDILDQDSISTVVEKSGNPSSLNQFYLLFRIREIFEYDFRPIVENFLKFLERESKNNSNIFQIILNRWFVLINEFFQPLEITKFCELIFSVPNDDLNKLFENDYLFEQQKLTEGFIEYISKSLDSKKSSNSLQKIEILAKFPIQCYPKRIKHVILDQLVEILFKSSTSQSQNEIILNSIKHIISTSPTFKSKIEIDLTTIFKFVEKNPNSDIFNKVWNHHYQQRKEVSSSKIINELIQKCVQKLSKNNQNLSSSFYISFIILKNSSSNEIDTDQLLNSFISASKTLFHEFIKSDSPKSIKDITWLLGSFAELNLSFQDFQSLKPLILKFSSKLNNTNDDLIINAKINIFKLFCQYFNESDDIKYFESLYIVLREQGGVKDELLTSLSFVFGKLSNNVFIHGFNHLLYSIDQDELMVYNSEILGLYWKFFKREDNNVINDFVRSISKILLNFNKFIHSESIINVLISIRSILLEKTWIINQYGLELILSLLSRVSDSLILENNEFSELIYQNLTLTLSNILLIHRFRLSNRHHILLNLFKSLLLNLSKVNPIRKLPYSIKNADSMSRVLNNLCEPPINFKDQNSNSLTSSNSLVKKSLRKYLSTLLCSFIFFNLKYSYDSHIREILLPGIFNIFDVLSQNELILVNTLLDNSGPQQGYGGYQQGPPQQGYYQQGPQPVYTQQPPQQKESGCCGTCCKILCCACLLEMLCGDCCGGDDYGPGGPGGPGGY